MPLVNRDKGGVATADCFAKSLVMSRTPPQAMALPCPVLIKETLSTDSDKSDTEGGEETSHDGCAMVEAPTVVVEPEGTIVQALSAARDKLSKQQTSGQPLAIKREVIAELDAIIQRLNAPKDATGGDRIAAIENDLQEIKAALKDALTTAKGKKTWAQVAAQASTLAQEKTPEITRREQLEKHRMEKAKTEIVITLRNASENMKSKVAGLDAEGITNGIRELVNKAGMKPSAIQSARKTPSHGIRVCCATKNEAEALRKLDWAQAFEGAAIVEPQYGIVVHGVSKEEIDFERDQPDEIKAKIESSNHGALQITRVAPLRKTGTRRPNADTQSIVVFTTNTEAADECILYGKYIGKKRHSAERYIPQCQIRQCFKCQGYGHTANTCTKAVTCGRCGQNHETKQCISSSTHCSQCKGSHTAWHHECPAWQREYQRLEKLKETIPHVFNP